LKEVDHALTRFCGSGSPPFPFKSADDYYVWASSHRHISSIRVPFLAINAADDPIVGFTPAEETTHGQTCALAVTPSGGHLGWFHGGSPIGRGPPPDRWIRKPVLEFLKAVAEDFIPDSRHGPPKGGSGAAAAAARDYIERDGFVLERGKDLVGYQVVLTGQIIDGDKEPASKGLKKKQGL